MTNPTPSGPSRKASFALRWATATALVVAVGAGGFILRGGPSHPAAAEKSRPRPAAHVTAPTGSGDVTFPDVPEITIPQFGERSASPTASKATADFARCRSDAPPSSPDVPSDWATHASPASNGAGLSFRYPAGWDVVDEDDQIGVASPDASRAFIAQTIPFDNPIPDVADLLTTMAKMRSTLDYSDARPVMIDGRKGCAVTVSGNGHEGRLVVVPTDGAVVVLVVSHDVNADKATPTQLWTILTSTRVDA